MESHEAGALLRPAGHQRNSRHASTLGVTLSGSERWVHYGFFCALRGGAISENSRSLNSS